MKRSFSRRPARGRSLVTKPWNKVPRTEKFWVPSLFLDQGAVNAPLIAYSTGTQYVNFIDGGTSVKSQSTVNDPGLRPFEHAKLHRFQGHIWAWLEASPTGVVDVARYNDGSPGGTYPPPQVEMLNYMWIKLKEAASTEVLNGSFTASTDLSVAVADLSKMLVRDDVLSWGTIPVYGVVPQFFINNPGNVNLFMAMNPMQYHQSHVARIPWPRLPKGGLNLRKGEALACLACKFAGPGSGIDVSPFLSNPDTERRVVIADVSRRLMSI